MHVLRTRKGRGYRPAEDDAEKCLHDVSPFDVDSGELRSPRPVTYTDTFTDALLWASPTQHPELVALTAGDGRGPPGCCPSPAPPPDRCFDVGIAEQHAVTAAAGMAMQRTPAGRGDLLDLPRPRLGTRWSTTSACTGSPVVFCLDRAGIAGDDGPSHHGVYDLALLTKVPGLTVYAPSSYEEVASC